MCICISPTCECNEVVRMHYPFEYDQVERSVRILGSCDGLICLATSAGYPFTKDYRLCIWNPLTREYKRILHNFDTKNRRLRCGFGYDPSIGDYKFVRIVDDLEKNGCFQAQVYTMRSDSWTFQSIPYVFPFGKGQTPSVLLGGALHWLGATPTRELNSEVIVSFDVSNDRFMDVGIPEETMSPPLENVIKNFGVFRDCLCLVVRSSCMVYNVWIMQDYGVKESWNKQFTINQRTVSSFWYPKPLWSLETGEILMSSYMDMGFYLFDPESETGKELSFSTPLNVWQRGVVEMEQHQCYVESLVSLESGTYAAERVININM